jgi:hypothetical protein
MKRQVVSGGNKKARAFPGLWKGPLHSRHWRDETAGDQLLQDDLEVMLKTQSSVEVPSAQPMRMESDALTRPLRATPAAGFQLQKWVLL